MTAMIPSDVMGVAKKVSAFLDQQHIPHAIAGGMAVSVHCHPDERNHFRLRELLFTDD